MRQSPAILSSFSVRDSAEACKGNICHGLPTDNLLASDVTIGGVKAGTITAELFADIVPKTAENFRQLVTGEFRYEWILHSNS